MPGLADDLPTPSSPRARAALDANVRVLAVADRLRDHWQTNARRYGLSAAQIKLLLSLAGAETATMRELAERINYDASNLTTLVDRLQRQGLVQRRPHASDRRVTEVMLTADGRRIRDEFWTALNAGGPLDPLTGKQLTALSDALRSALEPGRRP
jgi:DNA-binding MarR family transcriptional regulator